VILPETQRRTKNTNQIVYEQSSSLERFELVSEEQDYPKFIKQIWTVFINVLSSEIHNIFSSLKSMKSAWQPGDIKLTMRQTFDDNPGFIPFNGEDVAKKDFPDLYGAIGGEGLTSDDTTIRLPKSAGRVLKVSGLTEPTANENPDVYSGELPLLDRYSTAETRTNKVWIDGKPVYRKVIDLETLPDTTPVYKDVSHGITNIGMMITVRGVAYDSDSWIPLPYVVRASNMDIQIYAGVTYVRVESAFDWSDLSGYAILEYTKSTDSALPRGPETLRIRALLKT
jgi:hypothetical protein